MQPYPAPNSVLVLDDSQLHDGERIARLCSKAGECVSSLEGLIRIANHVKLMKYSFDLGVMLRYLPPFCPDLNPIKTAFSLYKSDLRKTEFLQDLHSVTTVMTHRICIVFNYKLLKRLYSNCGYEEVGV